MLITPQHFAELKKFIVAHDTEYRRQQYKSGEFPRSNLVKDLNKRYRWDLYWATVPSSLVNELYKYVNDEHIDTALRNIIPPL